MKNVCISFKNKNINFIRFWKPNSQEFILMQDLTLVLLKANNSSQLKQKYQKHQTNNLQIGWIINCWQIMMNLRMTLLVTRDL